MRATKNDLVASVATLDYEALLLTARVAYAHSLEKIYESHKVLRDCNINDVRVYLESARLKTESHYLVTVAETLHTLACGREREEIQITNK